MESMEEDELTKYRVSISYVEECDDGEMEPMGTSLWVRATDRLNALVHALECAEVEVRDLVHFDVVGVESFHDLDEEDED